MSMKFNEPEITETNSKTQEANAVPEAIEIERKNFMRMWLKIRMFSPYICDSFELDKFGFDGI